MKTKTLFAAALIAGGASLLPMSLFAQIGTRFPSEKKTVPDPVTGIPLIFLTSRQASDFGDHKIYQTHPDWTSDGKWVIFRSNRAPGQAMAVNEESGVIVQVTEKGYEGMLLLARHTMKLYHFVDVSGPVTQRNGPGGPPPGAAKARGATEPEGPPPEGQKKKGRAGGFVRSHGPFEIIETDLQKLFADSEAGTVQPASAYERICCTLPDGLYADGDMGIDATDNFIYMRVTGDGVLKQVPEGMTPAAWFTKYLGHQPDAVPSRMGGGGEARSPWAGLVSINIQTGEVKWVTVAPVNINHTQTNPWVPGEIVFAWETGGKAPQRAWTVMADGTGLHPIFPEQRFDWITHEAVITKDEVAIAILGLRKPIFEGAPPMPGLPGRENYPMPPAMAQNPSGGDDHPTGVGIVNLRTREMRIIGQLPIGNPGRSIWHVNGSGDGRWAVADDFMFRLWIIDRHTGEMMMLADLGHKTTAADHVHPTFSADSTKIEFQNAMLSANGHSLNMCVVHVPQTWLARTYTDKVPE
jgi:oligogalacturonide lyase